MRFAALFLTLAVLCAFNPAAALTDNTHATSLNGTNQYWSITDAAQVGLDISSDLTLCLRIKYDTYSSATGYMPVGKTNFGDAGTIRAYTIEQNISGANKFDFELGGTGGNVRKGVAWTPATGTWYHQCVVYKASTGAVDFFVNGSQQGTQQTGYPTSIPNNSRPFQIGAQFDGVTLSYKIPGDIDDVRIWARSLSSSEISSLHSDPCSFDNGLSLRGWWLFDNDGTDQTANNNDLTNNNSATFTTDSAYVCSSPPAAQPTTDTVILFE